MRSSKTSSRAKEKWLTLVADALGGGTLVKITLGGYTGSEATLQNIFVRPLVLRTGLRLSFLFRHETRDVTQNLTHDEGLARLSEWIGTEFGSAHLFTTERSAHFEARDGGKPRLILGRSSHAAPASVHHDRARKRLIDPAHSPWLKELGVATAEGRIIKGMEAKFRQINRFVELLQPLLDGLRVPRTAPLSLVDMGCGKGYLTFAACDFFRRAGWNRLVVRGIEARPELVELCNRVTLKSGFGFDRLRFETGTIANAQIDHIDVLVALHACDTATDDALAKGIKAGASLMLVAPCCHKEVRPQLRPPPVLAGALRHGILREREAEFVTDALRAALLEWAGYDTKVFEFVSTEHTNKNVMIAATKKGRIDDRDELERNARALAAFYGIQSQRLATLLGLKLAADRVHAGAVSSHSNVTSPES
jgi:SAM-dependent methyltransferase